MLALYVFWGRHARVATPRARSTWIPAASQALAVVAVILAFILIWLALILAGDLRASSRSLFLLRDRELSRATWHSLPG